MILADGEGEFDGEGDDGTATTLSEAMLTSTFSPKSRMTSTAPTEAKSHPDPTGTKSPNRTEIG